MTGIAGFLESAFVRIDVACRAGIEFHVLITDGPTGHIGLMTFFARHFAVKAREGIASLGMVEVLGFFPAFHVMALGAFNAQLALVRIGMAGNAVRWLSKEGFVQILHFDQGAIRRNHVRRSVAFFAGQIGVFAFELIARQPMFELLFRRFPMNEIEVFPIVLQVAAYAVLAIRILHLHLEVIAVLGGEILGDFLVAFQTFIRGSAGAELVA